MSMSQFEKRKIKVQEELTIKRDQIRAKADSASEATPQEPVYTQSGFDVYSSDGGRTYKVAEIQYNPETGAAKVIESFDLTRLVALTALNQKQALGILKKKK